MRGDTINSQEPSGISKQKRYIAEKGIVVQNTFRLYQNWIFTVTFEQLSIIHFGVFLGLFTMWHFAWLGQSLLHSLVCVLTQLSHNFGTIVPPLEFELKMIGPQTKWYFKTNCELEDCSGSRCTKANHKISFIRLLFASLPLPTLDKSCLLIVICWICVSGIC